jgi:DNA-binding MurR/RpiR family transcriptional regulator
MSSSYKSAHPELEGVFDKLNNADIDAALDMIAGTKTVIPFGSGPPAAKS